MENKLLKFIKNYPGDFYHDFPVVLELVCERNTDHYADYINLKERYQGASKIWEETLTPENPVDHLRIFTNLKYILEHGQPWDFKYISKYYES